MKTIAPEESRYFRRDRRVAAWLSAMLVALLVVSGLLPEIVLMVLIPIVAIAWLAAFAPAVFWPCPRCGRFYSLRFWPIGISWPWVDQCLHCGAELVKEPDRSA